MIPGINFTYCFYFIKHYWSATRIDVLHSPFVFKLYNTCIKRQKANDDIHAIEALRKALKQDNQFILQDDFGAGSSLFKGKKRRVKELVYLHAKQARIAQVFYFLIKQLNLNNAIELGTSLGLTTAYLGKALKGKGKVTGIEGSQEIALKAGENMAKLGLEQVVNIRHGHFDEVLPPLLDELKSVDFVYIDGNHRFEPTVRYFEQLLPYTHNNSVLVFDDIYWSKGMAQAWDVIKLHPKVSVSVDLFFVGLVFFRKEQAKQHFKLRVW